MSYLQDSRERKRAERRKIYFLLLFILAVLFLEQKKIMPYFSGLITGKAESALKESTYAGDGMKNSFWTLFSFKNSLIKEDNSLKEEIKELEAKVSDRDKLAEENISLKEILGRRENDKNVLASVLLKPNQSPYDTLILDVGSDQGVSFGSKVFAYGNVLIGEIREVYPETAKAVLFSSPKEEYQATASGTGTSTSVSFKVIGRGGGNFVAEFPRGLSVEEGMKVYTSGLSGKLLGTIDGVFSDPRDPFQSVIIKSPVNISELKWVLVSI